MSFQSHKISVFFICLCLLSCQKDKDILDRFLPSTPNPGTVITTVISDYPGCVSKDSIYWFQDASGHIESAYRYDSTTRKRKKVLSIDKNTPQMIRIDDGDIGHLRADILFNDQQQPYKVIFFDRMTSKRKSNSYNFTYGDNNTPGGLDCYMDSIYSSLTFEAYGFMSTQDYHYPRDSFEKLGAKMGTYISGEYIFGTHRGADLSAFSFVPFISFVVTSNLEDRYPSAMHSDIFDAYIWGEVMRPWLPRRMILGFYVEHFYPSPQPLAYYNYYTDIRPSQIIYTDGYRTITNLYP